MYSRSVTENDDCHIAKAGLYFEQGYFDSANICGV